MNTEYKQVQNRQTAECHIFKRYTDQTWGWYLYKGQHRWFTYVSPAPFLTKEDLAEHFPRKHWKRSTLTEVALFAEVL